MTNDKITVTCCDGHLPLELEYNILLRLPIKHLAPCRCVCKRWRDEIINSPDFIKSHTLAHIHEAATSTTIIIYPCLNRNQLLPVASSKAYSMDMSSSPITRLNSHHLPTNLLCSYPELIGSSNGMLCFLNVHISLKLGFWLYNPATGTSFATPLKELHRRRMLGFGYDYTTDDYKIFYSYIVEKPYKVDVEYNLYSFKSRSWRLIQPHFCLKNFDFLDYELILTLSNNNALHFIARNRIYAFDLGTEKFHKVPVPDNNIDDDLWNELYLCDVKGLLHLVIIPHTNIYLRGISIWVMKEYGVQQSWVKVVADVSVEQVTRQLGPVTQLNLRPFAYSEDGSEILIGIGEAPYFKAVARCDIRTGELNKVQHLEFPHEFDKKARLQVMPWSASLHTPALSELQS